MYYDHVEEVRSHLPEEQPVDSHLPAGCPVEGDGPPARGGRGRDACGGWRRCPEARNKDVNVRRAPPGVQLCFGHV